MRDRQTFPRATRHARRPRHPVPLAQRRAARATLRRVPRAPPVRPLSPRILAQNESSDPSSSSSSPMCALSPSHAPRPLLSLVRCRRRLLLLVLRRRYGQDRFKDLLRPKT